MCQVTPVILLGVVSPEPLGSLQAFHRLLICPNAMKFQASSEQSLVTTSPRIGGGETLMDQGKVFPFVIFGDHKLRVQHPDPEEKSGNPEPVSSEFRAYMTVKARFWPWLSGESVCHFNLFPLRSKAGGHVILPVKSEQVNRFVKRQAIL